MIFQFVQRLSDVLVRGCLRRQRQQQTTTTYPLWKSGEGFLGGSTVADSCLARPTARVNTRCVRDACSVHCHFATAVHRALPRSAEPLRAALACVASMSNCSTCCVRKYRYTHAPSTEQPLQSAYLLMHFSWKVWPHGNVRVDNPPRFIGEWQMTH